MRFNLVVHDPDALFNIIDQQRRDQAVIEANDAARRQRATQRDAGSVAAAETKLQGNDADKHDGSQRAKTAGVKAERNRRYENNECFVCGEQGHKQWDCPQSQQGKAKKGVHGQSHGQDPKQQQQQQQQQQQSTRNPAQHNRSKATGIAPTFATPTAGASGYKMLVILYVHPGKWRQSGLPSTLVVVIPCSSRNSAVFLGRKMWGDVVNWRLRPTQTDTQIG